jgi:hypothetical protein
MNVILMSKSKVDQNTFLWLSIFASDKVLIVSINISQEDFTEIMIIRVIVYGEGL